jgi:phospholipase C
MGSKANAGIEATCDPLKKRKKANGHLKVNIKNRGNQTLKLKWVEDKYHKKEKAFDLKPGAKERFTLNTTSSQGWYDFSVFSPEMKSIKVRYAGRLETGADGVSDPYMGRVQ